MQVYRTLSDAVILDWYISLNDKDRMSTCDVIYAPDDGGNNATSDSLLLSPFLPRQRTFVLRWLEPDRRYRFHMECVDVDGKEYLTKDIRFKTGE